MAETIYLNDGSMEVILEDKERFLEKLICEKLGEDAARCFRDFIAELKCEADWYLQMCRDACDSFTEIMGQLEAQQLNRDAIKEAARNAYNAICKNL